jgi:uncharacterized protein
MNISNFAIILTDDCNFDCAYCRLPKHKSAISRATLDTAIPFFIEHLSAECAITFFGGEPLLEFDLIRHTVNLFNQYATGKHPAPAYSITTNGTLLTDEMLEFLNHHSISILLSYDGEAHDDCRKPNTRYTVEAALKNIQRFPNIEFSTNSVFTPGTIHKLSQSLINIAGMGVATIEFSLDQLAPWNDEHLQILEKELDKLLQYIANLGDNPIPFPEFRPSSSEDQGIFACGGGRHRLAIAPDSRIWGCTHFHSYFKVNPNEEEISTYGFGLLEDFIANFDAIYPPILENNASLRQDMFHCGDTFCFLCQNVNQCRVCPIYTARATKAIGDIPPWMCRIAAIMNTAKTKLPKP